MNFREHLKEQMRNPEFEKECKAFGSEPDIIIQITKARNEQNLTQKELANQVGMKQSSISRFESGNYNPTIKFLKKLADGLGKELHIELR